MKFLVTGGAGFFGIHMCKHIANAGHDVISFDRDDFPTSELVSGIYCVKGDISDLVNIEKNLIGVDYVIHAAAELALADPKKIKFINGELTYRILQLCHKHSIKKFIYISSCAVYGSPRYHPIFENYPLDPMGIYGQAKLISENYISNFNDLSTVVIRPKSFIGEGRLGIFQLFFEWIDEGRKIPIFGNGKNLFQLLEVTDLVDACYKSCFTPHHKIIYNVGATDFGTVNDDLKLFISNVNSKSRLVHFPSKPLKMVLSIFSYLKISPIYRWVYETADKDSYVSSDLIIKELNWRPRFSNVDALVRTYRWYISQGKEMSKTKGTSHRVAWKHGIIKLVKYFF
jgi:nucleoside-diphosphate-sugar epimerase